MTAWAGVNLWLYSVLNEFKRKLSGEWRSWDSSGSHFGLVGSDQQIILGGDWEVNKQQVSQQYWTVDMDSPWPKGEGSSEWPWQVKMWLRPSRQQTPPTQHHYGPLFSHLQSEHSSLAVAAELDTKLFKSHSALSTPPQKKTNLNYVLNTAEVNSTNYFPTGHPLQIRSFSVALKPQCLYPLIALNLFLYPLPPNLYCSCLS